MLSKCEELAHWKRLWCWKGLGAGGRGDDRGWDGWMASPTWWMWELDHNGWASKNWCFLTVVLEKTLESPLASKEVKPVNPKGIQPWIFIERTDDETEDPVLWPPHVKSWLIGKDSDTGRDWRQEEKGTTEDETAGWHHRLDERESEWTLGFGDGQGGLACCDSWGHKESDMTERPTKQQQQMLFRLPDSLSWCPTLSLWGHSCHH